MAVCAALDPVTKFGVMMSFGKGGRGGRVDVLSCTLEGGGRRSVPLVDWPRSL